jgi:hypothetical protein
MIKHLSLALTAVTILLYACQPDPKETEEYKQLQEDKQQLSSEGGMKDSTINEMFGAFNRVSENLRAIREKQGLLGERSAGVEGGANMEQGIVADLRAIDSLLAENKKIISRLRKSSKDQGGKLTELEKTILEMERAMGEKDTEIGALKEQLTSTNASLASMIEMYQDKEQLAETQKQELNTGYYTVGSQKELRDNGVLTKEGGFIGIGKVSKLNTQGMNLDYFKRVDITQMPTIPVNAKKAKLITSHPEGSYKLVGEGKVESLTITDPVKFWSVSKYLVIQAD